MTRASKIIGGIFAALFGLVFLAAVGLYLFVTSDYVRAQIENHANAVSGRKTKIGRIDIDWAWTPTLRLQDVALSNADWGKADHMFKAKRIVVQIRIWPLLHGEVILPELRLEQPEIYLERNAQGESNWSSKHSPVAAGAVKQLVPEQRVDMPLIGKLQIVEGRVSYIDTERKLQLNGTALTAAGQAGGQADIALQLKGSLEKQPLSLRFVGGSALMLRDTNVRYPLDLAIDYGATHVTVKGTLDDPLQFRGADVQLSLSGEDLSNIYPLLGIPGPPTPPYRMTGNLRHEPGIWHFDHLAWHAGDSDLTGAITLDQRVEPSKLTADLVSDHLAFADLAPLVGATPGKSGNVSPEQRQTEEKLEAKKELFPDVPMQVERLRAMKMDVTLDARHVMAPDYLPVSALDMHVAVENGKAVVDPLTISLAGGNVTGTVAVDAHSDTPTTHVDLRYQNVDLHAFFKGSRYFTTTEGKMQGRVVLTGSGRSLAQVMGSANGEFVVGSTGGSVSSLLLSLAGLQIADALVLYITGDDSIPISCAMGRLAFDNGQVTFDKTLMDTRKSVVHVDGKVSLTTQAIDAKVTADPKQFDLLDLHAPVVVRGKIRAPDISIGRLIPIPTPVFGSAHDVACDARFRDLILAKP